ncbi:MAG: hypothetical protein JO165_04480 [Candidatus Eremiobacteraeota bacterium]|nr:hypothetical protein [Candidatus Eremiobacteraeota bacterium]
MKRVIVAVTALGTAIGGSAFTANAMPPFAQAYGVACSVCHTQVPALNAYGRYVQRTGYSSLDPTVLKSAVPVWIGTHAFYDSQDPDRPHQVQFGNVALHAAGQINGDWSYHVHQWLWQNNVAGGVDTLWVAYNNLLHRDGHLFIGKIEAPGPSLFSQTFDLAAFATPEMAVGEHVYENDANRWGAKLGYTHKNIALEAGWLASGQDLGGVSDFSGDTDKTFQWKAAYATPERPLEVGLYGSRGSFPLAEGGFDQYFSVSGYIQRDPVGYVPGAFLMYQLAKDANPGPDLGIAASNASTIEIYEPVLHYGMFSVRKEFMNDGLGTQTQSGDVDFSFQIARYLRLYTEAGIAQNSKPAWRYMIWWTTPVTRSLLPQH